MEICDIMKVDKMPPDVYSGDNKNNSNPGDSENEKKTTDELLEITHLDIIKKVIDNNDNNKVYGLIVINDHYETILLGSVRAREWLQYRYYQINDKSCSQDQCKEALQIATSEIKFNASSRKEIIYNRIAMVNSSIFYDMCTPDWKIIEITSDGWSSIPMDEETPMFERKQQQTQQVNPISHENEKYDALDEICLLLRIKLADRMMFKIHLISFFIEKYPIPIMIFTGDQGSIKTTLMQTVKMVVDPSAQLSSRLHKKMEDISIHLYNRYLSAFDNISNFNKDISDLICRVITGEGDSKRELYTNMDEIILNYKRKIIVNGIAPSLDYPDLIDRSVFYETSTITENERLTLEEFLQKRDEIMPYLIHQIFDILYKAITNYKISKIDLKGKMQRMSDFSIWGEAISRSMGFENLSFIQMYTDRIKLDVLDIVNSYPIFGIVQKMMDDIPKYEDTISNFYDYLKNHAIDQNIDIKSTESKFPKGPHKVREQIKILRPTFKQLGYEITLEKNYTPNKEKGWNRGAMIIRIFKDNEDQLLN